MSVIKRRKVMMAAVIAAVAVFVASALAAAMNLSGYERLKAAGFKLIQEMNNANGTYSNGMFWLSGALYIDDVETLGWDQAFIRDGERAFTRSSTYISLPSQDDDIFSTFGVFDEDVVTYSDEDVVYRWYGDGLFSERGNYWRDYRSLPDYEEYSMTPAEKRFIEAIADALIGESRNYFVSNGDTVSISLSGNQIPQLAQFAVAAFAERANEDFFDYGGANYYETIGPDARITYGTMEITLDGYDNVSSADIVFEIVSTVNAVPKPIRFEAMFRSKNVGSTIIEKPDGNARGTPKLPSYSDGTDEIIYSYGSAIALGAPWAAKASGV